MRLAAVEGSAYQAVPVQTGPGETAPEGGLIGETRGWRQRLAGRVERGCA